MTQGSSRVKPEDLGADVEKILKFILQPENGKAWTGLIWLRMKSSGLL
jgi:hypothetical protein